jgi:hypothetical protein
MIRNLFSLVKTRIKGMCTSCTLATDGRSDYTEIFDHPAENDPDGSEIFYDVYHKDADTHPNISTKYSGYSIALRGTSDIRVTAGIFSQQVAAIK